MTIKRIMRGRSLEVMIDERLNVYITPEFYKRITGVTLREMYQREGLEHIPGERALIRDTVFAQWLKMDSEHLYQNLIGYGTKNLYYSITQFYFNHLDYQVQIRA